MSLNPEVELLSSGNRSRSALRRLSARGRFMPNGLFESTSASAKHFQPDRCRSALSMARNSPVNEPVSPTGNAVSRLHATPAR